MKNIGTADSPSTHLKLEFRRVMNGVLVASQKVRVAPLKVNQSLRFQLNALPRGHVQMIAQVDPDQKVPELSEQNNELNADIDLQPEELAVVDVWVTPNDNDDP